MHKKTLISFLTILIVLSLFLSIPGTTAEDSKATSSQQRPPDTQLNNISLQTLIDTAAPGTTIQLPGGTYPEILTITKPLHLIGNTTTQTSINPTSPPNGFAIHVTAEDVTLSNLEIINHASGLYTTGVKISASHTIIEQCTIHDTPIGVALWSTQNTITETVFHHCSDEGIVLLGTTTSPCSNNTITSCIFNENCDGIELQYATNNHITSCRFISNTHAGIDAIESDNNHNTITDCTFTDNNAYGVYLAQSSYNLITHCSFSNDTLALIHSPENTLINTHIQNIHLLDDSSLILDHCNETTVEKIVSDHSSFEIRTIAQNPISAGEKTYTARYHLILIHLLSYLKTLGTFAEQLTQARM